MAVIKGIAIAVLVVVLVFIVFLVVVMAYSTYLSIPYDEWVESDKKKRGKKYGRNSDR
ncbi:hypothetical protein [Hominenteromicrobium sp.]|jgi:Tfp pilus assembly protein PilO|uniref:hypothetical protein n=1 Tax=Hominenteromicrobium sp. TaxID=3073581 RepID=UPI00205ECB76|nr:MAG TPA: HemY protein N-terminus [Caudoviricetes sp.]